jgi:NADH-quinone oxidoreductase subunit D/NADH-quinone oxidoreductase subunit C/D
MYRETEILKQPGLGTPDVFGDMIINVGPQHPATHGVLHLVITLNGETIKKVDPHLGYIHRSIEKMCESLSFRQFIYVTKHKSTEHRSDFITHIVKAEVGCVINCLR